MRVKTAVVSVLLIIAALGCQGKPAATVDGERISEKALRWQIAIKQSEHARQGVDLDAASLRSGALQELVIQKLLAMGAKENNIEVSDEELKVHVEAAKARMGEKDFAESLRGSAMTEAEYAEVVRDRILAMKFGVFLVPDDAVTEEEVVDYYRDSPTPFLMPETLLVRFIHVPTLEKAEAVEGDVRKLGFDKAADSLKGGGFTVSYYGWTDPGVFSPEISDALRRLKAGQHTAPLKGREGYFLFNVKERRKQRIKSLDEAREEIHALLLDKKRRAGVAHWTSSKMKRSSIITN